MNRNLVFVMTLVLTACASIPKLSEQSLKAQTLLGIANEEWRGQRQAICRAGFNVESATLTIHTRGETVASAGLNVVVLKAGSKRTLTSGQKLTVSLVAAAPLGLEAEVPAQLQRQLRNAFVSSPVKQTDQK